MAAKDVVITNQTTGETASVAAPANIILQCPPLSDRNARMVRPGQYQVTDMDKMEASTQVLYSFVTYPAGGSSALTFFQNPYGAQGITLADTNMQSAGMLPSPQKFLVQGLGVRFISGLAASTLGAASADNALNDTNAILRTGIVTLDISSKNYFTTTPLAELPCRAYTAGMAGLSNATTPAAGLASAVQLAWVNGDVFRPNPLLLESTMNFRVTVTWPTLIPVPSTNATSRLGIYLYGTLYRPPQ